MKLTNIFSRTVPLAFLALLGVAGTKWYLQNKVETVLEETIKKLYPIAAIKYEDTYSSLLDSSIGVENVTINPRAVRDEIKIERIVFQAPNIKFLLDAKSEFESGNIPKKMLISINGFTINTSGGISRLLDNNTPPPALGARDNAYGCADVNQFKFSELNEMGYDQLSVDLTLNYQYNPAINELDVTALWSNRLMFEFEITGIFEVENSKFKLNQTRGLFDRMSSAKIAYRDLGYNRSTIDYCNHYRGDRNYISAHIKTFKKDLENELNLIPSNKLVAAYRKFMLNSGVIKITSDLQHPINPKYLALYKPRDAVLLVRPEITVNDQTVDIPYADLLNASGKLTEKKPTKDNSTEKEIVLKPRNNTEFITVDIQQLAEYIGDMVRIKTKRGITREGILIDVDTMKVKVEVSRRGGVITYPIQVSSITNTEVKELLPINSQIRK